MLLKCNQYSCTVRREGLREAGWSNTRIDSHLGRMIWKLFDVDNSGSRKDESAVAEDQVVPGTQMSVRNEQL